MAIFKKFISLFILVISAIPLSAEIIVVVKKSGNQLTPLTAVDKNKYLGNPIKTFGTSNSIFDVIYRYQWPTCFLFYPSMSNNEKAQLFAQNPNAEANFINQKIQASYPNYQAIHISDTIYQLFALSYYLKNYSTNECKTLRNYLFDYFSRFSVDESGYTNIFESNEKFIQDCKDIYTNSALAQAHFTINCELGKYLVQKGWLNTIQNSATLKTVAANLIDTIIQTYATNKAVLTNPQETRSKEAGSDRFNFEKFNDELDNKTLKNDGIVARLIDAEFKANQKNQALLVRGTGTYKQPILTNSGVIAAVENLAAPLLYRTLDDLYKKYTALQDPNNNYSSGGWNPKLNLATSGSPLLQPRSLSYGLFPFTGAFYCIDDMPYDYALKDQTYFHSLLVPKEEYCKDYCHNLFLLPPFCCLAQLFGHSTSYHGYSKAAIPPTQINNIQWGIYIDGFGYLSKDPDKILLLDKDPIEQAALLTDFTAKNFSLLKVPKTVKRSLVDEENRLRTDTINAEKFYRNFLANPEITTDAKKQESKIRKQAPPTLTAPQAGQHPISTVWANVAHSKQNPSYVASIRDANDKKDLFINDCKKYSSLNTSIPNHITGDERCRIATYNVHFWTNPHEYENFEKIMQAIKSINADILILEEVTWGNEDSNSYAYDYLYKNNHDEWNQLHTQALENVESEDWDAIGKKCGELCLQWLKNHNMPTSVKEEILQQFKDLGYIDHIFADAPNKPDDKPFGNVIFSKYPIKNHKTAFYTTGYKKEKRSYAKAIIELPENKSVVIYGTHLDVNDATGKTRAAQIQELTQIIDADKTNYKNILVAGDFNEIKNENDYQDKVSNKTIWKLLKKDYAQRKESISTRVSEILSTNGFTDSFDKVHAARPKFTVWSGTAVDFIYLKNWNLPIGGSYVLYNAASDHIPVILDITLKQKDSLSQSIGQLSQKLSDLQQRLTTLNAQLKKLRTKMPS